MRKKQTHALSITCCHYAISLAMLVLLVVFYPSPATHAQPPKILIMGDSLGEGVQSADASQETQKNSYACFIAKQMGAPLPLPLVESGPAGVVGDTWIRFRRSPHTPTANLSVSGADLHALLHDRANASRADDINSEMDLVNFPRIGSQMEIAESIKPPFTICWIGSNDVLRAVTAIDQLDGSQMTSIEKFETGFNELTRRLGALGGKVVFANIPDVTKVGFLVDGRDLLKFLGSDYGLPEGTYTSVVVMLLIRYGLDDGSLLDDSRFVLDAAEVKQIQKRIRMFNAIIEDGARSLGMPVADIHGLLDEVAEKPPEFFGTPVTPRFLEGGFSLDGIHPSNLGHALVANAFIETINTHFRMDIPPISDMELHRIFLEDPFQDMDGDGKVRGRLGAGLLESVAPLMGLSGDLDDFIPLPEPVQFNQTFDITDLRQYLLLLHGDELGGFPDWNALDFFEIFQFIWGLPVHVPSLK